MNRLRVASDRMTDKSWEMKAWPGLGLYQLAKCYVFDVDEHVHVVQMALLQHNSLYESIASSLHRAQKKALGKTLVDKDLSTSARDPHDRFVYCVHSKLFQVIGKRHRLWIGGHDEVVSVSSPI